MPIMSFYFELGVLKDIWIHWLYIGAIAVINICLFSWFVLSVFDEKVHYAAMIIIGVFMLAAGKFFYYKYFVFYLVVIGSFK